MPSLALFLISSSFGQYKRRADRTLDAGLLRGVPQRGKKEKHANRKEIYPVPSRKWESRTQKGNIGRLRDEITARLSELCLSEPYL